MAMESDPYSVKVTIMQREFTIACTEDERQSVRAAAAYLDEQMRTVFADVKVLGFDRCAVMAGLNIAHELLALRETKGAAKVGARLENLNRQVDQAVGKMRRNAQSQAESP